MSARRAVTRWWPPARRPAPPPTPAVFWGRIGRYEAVSRDGILFLLAPGPDHPARRVRADA